LKYDAADGDEATAVLWIHIGMVASIDELADAMGVAVIQVVRKESWVVPQYRERPQSDTAQRIVI
jgi:hypothetical protein